MVLGPTSASVVIAVVAADQWRRGYRRRRSGDAILRRPAVFTAARRSEDHTVASQEEVLADSPTAKRGNVKKIGRARSRWATDQATAYKPIEKTILQDTVPTNAHLSFHLSVHRLWT